jgi:polygalacturonase
MLKVVIAAAIAGAGAVQGGVCDVVRDCGAVADNSTNAAPAITSCAQRCSTLVFPANSVILSGSIDFSNTSGLTVLFEDNAQLYFSPDAALYPLQLALPFQGATVLQWQACLYGRNITDFTLRGPSSAIIDGNGWEWWNAFNNGTLQHQRPKLLELVDGQGIVVEGLTFRNSPFWSTHPIFCSNVRFTNVTVLAPRAVGNTDGIDPDSCDSVLIENCYVDVGDDAISLKSGPHDVTGALIPTQNVLVRNTTIMSRNIAIGSACFAGIYNCTFLDTVMGNDDETTPIVPWAIKFKSHYPNGGVTANISFVNTRIGTVGPNTWQQPHGGTALILTEVYPPPPPPDNAALPALFDDDGVDDRMAAAIASGRVKGNPVPLPTLLTDVSFINLSGISTIQAGNLDGLNTTYISNLLLSNVTFAHVSDAARPWTCSFIEKTVAENVSPPLPAKGCGL